MSNTFRKGPGVKPIAIVIAAQMRVAMPKAAQPLRHQAVNVQHALKSAANSSPTAKAAFKRAAPAVKAATPHLNALAQQSGKGLLLSLRHGVAAAHSLRQATREMAKESPSPLRSVKSAFKDAAASSPAAAAAFKGAGPAAATAQKHVAALSRMQGTQKPGLLSSLGHGIQAMRALREVTKGMKEMSGLSPLMPAKNGQDARPEPRPSLLSSLGQGARMLRALHGKAQTIAGHGASSTASGHTGDAQGTAPGPFAVMLIARRNSSGLSAFKDRT